MHNRGLLLPIDYALGASAGYDVLKDVTAISSMFGYDCSIISPRETYTIAKYTLS